MTQHNYTDTEVKTAAAAVNAGTCLEDGNSEDNIMSNVGNAVKAVNINLSSTMFYTINVKLYYNNLECACLLFAVIGSGIRRHSEGLCKSFVHGENETGRV